MYDENIDLLVREIRNHRSTVLNSILTRKEHPTYGYTKTKIRATLNHLEGMVFAWWIVTGGEDPKTGGKSLGAPLLATRMAYALLFDGENIDDLRRKVEAA